MGVDYSPVVAIGKQFDDRAELEAFIRQHITLTGDEEEQLENDFLEWLQEFGGDCLNYYYGDYFYIGFDISCRSPEKFANSYKEAVEKWQFYFRDVPFDVINSVKVW